jgi:hypothetical protein
MTDESRALAPMEAKTIADPMADAAASIKAVKVQLAAVQQLMREVMVPDEDYGIIPGCKKPSLYKPGAEKLCLMFRLRAEPTITEERDGNHLTIKARVVLYSIVTGLEVGAAEGRCSTKESKYAYRNAAKVCPQCGKESIIKGKEEFGGGWLCFAKKGGCGAKWADGAAEIESQADGKVANEDIADQYNTVLQMAVKRGYVSVARTATAAGSIFGDMEQRAREEGQAEKPVPQRPQAKAAQPPPPAATNGTAWRGKLANVETKAGVTKDKKTGADKPYTLYTVVGADGWRGATFSDSDADIARSIIKAGDEAEIAYEQGQYGPKIKTIQPLAFDAPDAEEPGANG